MAAATTEGAELAEGVEAGVAEATRETALVVAATRGATPKVAATLSQDAAGTRAGTSTQGTRGTVEGIKGGEGEAASCSRCAHNKGALFFRTADGGLVTRIISFRSAI